MTNIIYKCYECKTELEYHDYLYPHKEPRSPSEYPRCYICQEHMIKSPRPNLEA